MLKITVISIVFMFLASALIIPVGMSYAAFPPGFTESNPSSTTPSTNQTSTNMTMTPSTPVMTGNTTPTTSQSPLNQFKSGVAAKSVQCQSGFSLVLKAEDGSPACVHSSSVQILIQRGWAATQ